MLGSFWKEVAIPFLQHYAILLPVSVLGLFYSWHRIRDPWKKCDGLRRSLWHAIPLFIVLIIIAYGKFDRAKAYRETELGDARYHATQSRDTWLQIILEDRHEATTTQLVDVSQGLSEVTSRTFDLLKANYPQSELHSLGIFLVAPDRSMEDVFSTGAGRVASTSFALSDSFVGSTIDNGTRYCPDVTQARQDPENCLPFKPPDSGIKLDFVSLLCHPLGLGQGRHAFASVCVNSKKAHAFDANKDAISNSIEEEIGAITPLLKAFQEVRACVNDMISHTNAKLPNRPNCGNSRT